MTQINDLRAHVVRAEAARDHQSAARALMQIEALGAATPADLLRCALHHLLADELEQADASLRRAMSAGAPPAGALAVAAQIAIKSAAWARLWEISRKRLELTPNDDQAREHLSRSLLEQGDLDAAAEAFAPLMQSGAPVSPARALIFGQICLHTQRFDEAKTHLEFAASADPNSARARVGLARLATFEGRLADAEALCREAALIEPNDPRPLQQLAVIQRGSVDKNTTSVLQRLYSETNLPLADRAGVGFSLGDIAFRAGEAETALKFYSESNALRRDFFAEQGFDYTPIKAKARFERLSDAYDALGKPPPLTDDAPRPVFVIGPPRSGTTLIESILARHPDVAAHGEVSAGPRVLDAFERRLDAEAGVSAPKIVERHAVEWRRGYSAATFDTTDKSFTAHTDKMPGNGLAAPLLMRLFPAARFIVCRRTPFDVAVSIFRHQFPGAYDWAHRLEDIANFLERHERLIAQLAASHSDRFAVIDYDALVAAPDEGRRTIVSAAGLTWDAACDEANADGRRIATFSSVQARKPISRSASDGGSLFRPLMEKFATELDDRIAKARSLA